MDNLKKNIRFDTMPRIVESQGVRFAQDFDLPQQIEAMRTTSCSCAGHRHMPVVVHHVLHVGKPSHNSMHSSQGILQIDPQQKTFETCNPEKNLTAHVIVLPHRS